MKTTRTLFLVAAAVLTVALLAGCPAPFSGSADDSADGVPVPNDQVADVSRSVGGGFTFETIYPVDVELTVLLFETDESGFVSEELTPDAAQVFVTLADEAGNPVFSGLVPATGTIRASLQLPAAPEDVTLTLRADGFESRTLVISDVAKLEKIDRTLSLWRIESGYGPAISRSVSGGVDTDGDGVPDIYDAFPNDPDSAFVQNVPAEGVLTVAFEDLFGRSNAGDADYNDFIGEYSVQEILNADNYVTSIRVDATARVKLAGYNHRFGIRIDDFDGEADLTRTYVDRFGIERSEFLGGVTAPVEVELFEYSATAVGKSAWFELEFADAQRTPESSRVLSAPPYNPWVIVRNTGHDIHLIDREPLTELLISMNPDDRFVDGDGFPWALLVPTDWEHPAEGARIDSVEWYPRFTDWRLSEGEDHTDWYNFKGEPFEPAPKNSAPYPVTGPTQEPSFQAFTSADQYYQLEIAQVGGQSDPDGDQVFFRSTALPSYMTLNADTGLVTILGDPRFAGPPAGTVEVEFWSEDEDGADTSDAPYVVTFTLQAS